MRRNGSRHGGYARRAFPPPQPIKGPPIVTAEAVMTLPWVWRIIHTTAGVCANMPLRREGDSTAPVFSDTFRKDPIGQMGYTSYHLLRDTYIALQIHGMAFWEPVSWDMDGAIDAVVPLWSDYAYPVRWGDGQLRVHTLDGHAYTALSPSEVIWFQLGGVLGGDEAYSPLRFLARSAGEQILQAEHSAQALLSGGSTQAGLYWGSAKDINPNLAGEWATAIQEATEGRTLGPVVVGDGLEAKPLGMSWQELQMIESRRFTAVEACAGWGIPPGLLGVSMDGASQTYSNLQQDLQLWDSLTLGPLTRAFTETVGVWWSPCETVSTELLRPTPMDLARISQIELQSKYRTVDEVRESHGWDPNPDLEAPSPADMTALTSEMAERERIRLVAQEEMSSNGSGPA